MWKVLAKLGAAVLATVGIDMAVDSYQDYSAQQAEAAQDAKEAKMGKIILAAAALFFGYKLLTKK